MIELTIFQWAVAVVVLVLFAALLILGTLAAITWRQWVEVGA